MSNFKPIEILIVEDNSNDKVVFLDLKLPKINGFEVLKKIKSNPMTQSIPIVVETSSQEDPDNMAAYELVTNSYVGKPVNFEGFIKAMRQAGYWSTRRQAICNS